MSVLNVNNFAINRVVRAMMFDSKTGEQMFAINSIADPVLTITADQVAVVDALGATVMTFDRSKSGTFAGSNSFFDMNLLAAQSGTDKIVATETEPVLSPMMEEITTTAAQTEWVLKGTPIGPVGAEIPYIYELKRDGTLGTRYPIGATASATEFALDVTTKTITLPTGLAAGTRLFVNYEFNMIAGTMVVNDATHFPRAGTMWLQVMGADICDVSTEYLAYFVFPNAKLDSNFELSLTPDGGHNFQISMSQDYCSVGKVLFYVIIPDVEAQPTPNP